MSVVALCVAPTFTQAADSTAFSPDFTDIHASSENCRYEMRQDCQGDNSRLREVVTAALSDADFCKNKGAEKDGLAEQVCSVMHKIVYAPQVKERTIFSF